MKEKIDYSSVKVLLALDNPIVRRGVWSLLQTEGFRDFTIASTHIQASEALAGTEFDLIIMVSDMGDMPISHGLREVRYGKFNSHPFPVAVLFSTSSEQQYLLRQLNYGPDTILVMPVVPSDFLTRVRSLSQLRKPFVVTYNYIGPDRRKQARTDAKPAPMLEVPNPILARASGQPHEILQRDIVKAVAGLNRMKIRGNSAQIRWLADNVQKERAAGVAPTAPEVVAHLTDYAVVIDDLKLRTSEYASRELHSLLAGMAGLVSANEQGWGRFDKLIGFGRKVVGEIDRDFPA